MAGQGNPSPTRTSYPVGLSGNPGGRPADREVAALARRYTPDAIRALVEICRSSESPSARVAAASAILDRGWGKPRQDIDMGGGGGIANAVHLHLYAVQRLEAVQRAAEQLEAPAIEATADELSAALLERMPAPLPEEALPLWDAAPREQPGE